MNCCNEYEGTCAQGRDCPVRKKRAQETYKEFYEMNLKVADPYDDVTETFKALIAVIAVTGAVTLLAFVIWGK